MTAPFTNSELLWRLFRRHFCRRSNEKQESLPKRLFSRFSHSEKHPVELEVEGDAGISLPWEFRHHVHVFYDPCEGRFKGLPDYWPAALEYPEETETFNDCSVSTIFNPVEILPSCPHHDSCPFRNLDLEKSYLVFKKDDVDSSSHLERSCVDH